MAAPQQRRQHRLQLHSRADRTDCGMLLVVRHDLRAAGSWRVIASRPRMAFGTLMLQPVQLPSSTNALRDPDSLGGASFPAFFCGLGLLTVGFTLALIGLLRQHWLLRSAKRALDPKAPLRPGVMHVRGKVALDGDGPAVCVRIHQVGAGAQDGSGGQPRSWSELSRDASAAPFYLEHASGEVIRVEPGREVFLIDALSRVEQTSGTRRIRIAELTAGEMATIHGTLSEGMHDRMRSPEGYRSAPRGWILRPIGNERMLISTEPLEERHRKRRYFHTGWLAAFTLALGMFGAINYAMAAWLTGNGQVVQVDATETTTWTTRDQEGHVTTHYGLKGSLAGATEKQPVEVETNKMAHGKLDEALKKGGRVQVPFWKYRDILSPGTHPSISIGKGIFDLVAGFLLLIVFTVMSFVSRGWYERGTIDESDDSKVTGEPG